MGVRKTISKGLSKVLSPTQWLGMDSIKQNGKLIGDIAKGAFRIDKKQSQVSGKSFEECLRHYGVTEEGLKKRMENALQVVWFCLILAGILLPYSIYLIFTAKVLAGVVALILMFVMLSYAFREHFQYFQMKERRLGCTFKDWFNATFKGAR